MGVGWMKGSAEWWEVWRKDESDDNVWTRGPRWPLLQHRCPHYGPYTAAALKCNLGFLLLMIAFFKSCGLFSDSKLIYLGRVSVFFLRSCYFAWDWHKWSLNYVEIAGVIAFIALVSIDECPAGYWLYTHSDGIYVLLRDAIQYKYNTNVQYTINNKADKFAPYCSNGHKEGIGSPSSWFGPHSGEHWFTFSYSCRRIKSHSAW